MPEVFVDTSGWVSLFHRGQRHHALASSLYRGLQQQGVRVVTNNYVLAELVAVLTSPLRMPRPRMVSLVDKVRKSPRVEVVHVDQALDADAWQLLSSRLDKEWSLVDCASFVLMQRRGIVEALTTDHHFEQAGLVRLLQ